MSKITGVVRMPCTKRKLIFILGVGACLCSQSQLHAASEDPDLPCEAKLSKNARMIYDIVLEKREHGSDRKELAKEVTRDLITENRISKEEATVSVKAALNCLDERAQ